jgi:hypothetical protein
MNAGKRFGRSASKIAVALLLVVGLYLLGIILTPPTPRVQAVYTMPNDSNPPAPQPENISGGGAFSGTLASFTALIPEFTVVNLPLIGK